MFGNISLSSWNDKCFGRICGGNQNTLFIFSIFFPEIVPFMKQMDMCGTVVDVTDEDMAHAHCVLDT